jgi:hypothetical protein
MVRGIARSTHDCGSHPSPECAIPASLGRPECREGGLLSTESACALYALSLDELLSWRRTLARDGLRGLKIRALSDRQHRLAASGSRAP